MSLMVSSFVAVKVATVREELLRLEELRSVVETSYIRKTCLHLCGVPEAPHLSPALVYSLTIMSSCLWIL